MRHLFRMLAVVAAFAAVTAPAAANEPCYSYEPGPVIFTVGPPDMKSLVVRGPGSLSVTPTDCV